MMTHFDQQVLALDLAHLDDTQIKFLHDLKAKAFAESAQLQLAQLKMEAV